MFIVLVKGKYEYVIRNFSLLHTLAFYQEDSQLKEDFAVLRPCTYRGFTFPDPDVPRDLRGRIAGAGKDRVVQYDIDDLSKTGKMTGLTLPGQRQLLDVAFHMSAGQRVLTFRDRRQRHRTASAQADEEAVAAEEFLQRSKSPMDLKADAGARTPGDSQLLQQGGLGTALIELHVDLFLAGLHVCLVDTLLPVPQELMGFTVDYVQLVKPAGERAILLEVHNVQCDEFGEGRVIFGPAASGLNSQRSPEADVPDFQAQPLFSLVALGPRQSENPLYDPDKGLFTLQNVAVNLQALEAGLDVGRLLALALRLQSWTKALDLGEVSTARAASQTLLKVLAKGIPTPQKGGMTICYVGRMMVKPISLAAEIILKKRQKAGGDDDDDDEDLEVQLRRLSAGLNPALRAIVSFFAKLGTAFAEASPRFSFSKLDLRPDPQSSAVLVSSVSKHYLKQLQWQVAGVLGSLQVLGDPVGLFGDVKEGFHLFFKKTAEELQGQRSSIGSGVHDLVGGTLGAALGSVATISGSVKDTLGTVAGGPIGEEKRAENLAEGIDMSLASLAGGISEAVTGLVEQPIEQYESDGCVGLVKGSAQGVLGVVTRPIEGLFGAAEKMAQGAEGQVRGTSRGYAGLRRPPRVDFCVDERGRTGHVGLQVLERGFFWPKWSLRVVSVSLPDVWLERRIKRLFVSLVHEGEQAESDVHITRGRVADTWALESIVGFCGPLQLGARAGSDSAEGRVGCLRGPFRAQVEALVEGNLEMTMPFRVVIGQGRLPIRDFNDAMLSRMCDKLVELRFSVKAVGSPIMGADFSKREGEVIGEVVACLSPSIDPKIMPLRFVPHTVGGGSGFDRLPKLGPAAAAPIGLEANAGGLLALEGGDGVAPLALPLAVPVSRRS